MAEMTKKDPAKTMAEKLYTIEELAKKLAVKAWVFAGTMTANGWATGKQMTKQEFKSAVEAWLKAPMSGRKG